MSCNVNSDGQPRNCWVNRNAKVSGMHTGQQDSSEMERVEGRTEAVSTKVTRSQKQSLQLVAAVRKTDLSSLIYELAIGPLLSEADAIRDRLTAAESG